MNRPPRRQSSPSIWRSISRMGRTQAIFVAITLLVVCSVIGGSLGTILLDAVGSDETDGDSEEFNASARDDFIDELQATVEADPNDAGAMSLLANVLAQDGRIDEAIGWYERSLAVDTTDVQVRL